MHAGVIINPISGRPARDGGGSARAARARDIARQCRVDAEVRVTDRPGHAVELARAFTRAGAAVVIAWGGDGTVNEVAGPLIGSPSALGIVPAGSGDGLARGLGLPRVPEDALAIALGGAVSTMDVGYVGTRHFLNIAGVGFDAAVAVAFNRRRRRGGTGYVFDGLTSVWQYASQSYELDLDGESFSGRRFLVAFANGSQYGNGLEVAPDADPRDGRLNAVVVSGGSPVRQLWRSRRLFFRQMAPAEGVVRRDITRARIRGDRLVCQVDGETFEANGELAVRIDPGAIRVTGIGRGRLQPA